MDTRTLDRSLGQTIHADRCIGSLLACACGDILGAHFEGTTRAHIQTSHGRVHSFVGSSRYPPGTYTDDTEMTLALATSVVACGGLNAAHCAATYAAFFAAEPHRGYGPSASTVLAMLCDGADYRTTGTSVHKGGSYANGGAMRIAPLGLAFRQASDDVLHEAVRLALLPTHVHREAVDAAFVQAKAVGLMACAAVPQDVDVLDLLGCLQRAAHTVVVRDKLDTVSVAYREKWRAETVLNRLCTSNEFGKHFQIRAADAVACALWSFAMSIQNPERCIMETVELGGDTDTLGAMAGALAGALHGTSWLPLRWYDNIENEGDFGATRSSPSHPDLRNSTCIRSSTQTL